MPDKIFISKEHISYQVAYGIWVIIIPVIFSFPSVQRLAAAQGLWLEFFLLIYALTIGVMAPELLSRYFQFWIANRIRFTTYALIIHGKWILVRHPMLHFQTIKNPHSGVYAYKRDATLHEVKLMIFSEIAPLVVLTPIALIGLWLATDLPKPISTSAFGLSSSFGFTCLWIFFQDFVSQKNPQSLWGVARELKQNPSDIVRRWNASAITQEVQSVRPREQSAADLETIQIFRTESASFALLPYWRAIDLEDLDLAESKLWEAEKFVLDNPDVADAGYVWNQISQFSCALWDDHEISDTAYAMWAENQVESNGGGIEIVRESKWGDQAKAKELLSKKIAELQAMGNEILKVSHELYYRQFVPELFD